MVTCVHCGEEHPESAKFCADTGKPMPPPAVAQQVRPLGDEKGVFDFLREAADLYKAHWRTLLITAALLFVPASFITSSAAPQLSLVGRGINALILYGLVLPLTQGALTIAVADRRLGGEAGWREHWMSLLRRVPLLVSALVPAALMLAAGFVLAVIPGLVLAFFFIFVVPVVLLEGVGGTAALRRSYELVRSDWLRTAIMLVAFGVTNVLAHWLAALLVPRGAHFVANLLGNLLLVVVMPVPIIGAVLLYLDLRRKVDGLSDDDVRTQLEKLRSGA